MNKKLIGTIIGVILFIIALILLLFGVGLIWSSGSDYGDPDWFSTGIILVSIALAMVIAGIITFWLAFRQPPVIQEAPAPNISYNIDLPDNVKANKLVCTSCGGELSMDNIQMAAGAPVVNCPYCNATYQLTEEPKW